MATKGGKMARFLATVGFLVLAALVVNRFTESPGPPAELASEARVDSDAEAAASPKEIIAAE